MKVKFGDKSALNENPQIPEANKITDENINELKNSINAVYDLIMDKIYAVGDLYFSTNNENPEIKLGFGKWQAWGQGRVPVGVDISQMEFNSVEKIGGNKNNVAQISFGATWMYYKQKPTNFRANKRKLLQSGIEDIDAERNDGIQIGDGVANNLQPYITCYMWKRIS